MAENESTATYNAVGSEDGYISLGVPDTTGIRILLSNGLERYGFVRFTTFSGSFDDLDTPLDPPIYTSLILNLTVAINHGAGGVISVYFPPVPYLDNAYDAAEVDYLVEANLVGQQIVEAGVVEETEFNISLDLTRISPHYLKRDWDGKLAFGLSFANSIGTISLGLVADENTTYPDQGPSLTATWVPFLTGKSGPYKAHSRVDRCDKCGIIDVREKFVRDGYYEGLWVCRECYDPEEPKVRGIRPDGRPIND